MHIDQPALLSEQTAKRASSQERLPIAVYLLGTTIFGVTTSEFMVAGIMPSLSTALDVSVGEIGYLISFFALGMAIGGPVATALLLLFKVPNKPALIWLLGLFVFGSVLTAIAPDYFTMAIGRVLQGVSSAGCFGIALTICANLVSPENRGRASSFVLAGLMLSPVLGVPVTALIDQAFGWRASFWSIVILAVLSMIVVLLGVPSSKQEASAGLRSSFAELKNGKLWAAYLTSGLIIGATLAAFSFFSPIFTDVAGLPGTAIPYLLAAYGTANVIGNLIIGRYADKFTIPVLVGGLATLALALAVFASFAGVPAIGIAAFVVIGFSGVSMNPAMVARVMRAANPGPLVNAMHASVITAGLAFGTWAGGVAIDAGLGLTAPLWIGFALAVLGLLSLAPPSARRL